MLPPRAILFDWDNTLVDSWLTIHEALNFLMRAMDKPEWSLADTKEKVRLSLREAFPLHFGERWEEASDIYLERFRTIHLDRLTPASRARGVTARSGGAGDLPRGRQQQDRRVAAARSRAARLVGVFRQRRRRWRRTCRQAGLRAGALGVGGERRAGRAEVWFVGDTAVDIECARNSGCIGVLLADPMPPEAFAREFSRFAPDLSFADEAGLLRGIQGLRIEPPRPSS